MAKKLITLDGLAVFLSELRKEINAGSGKCFDAEELARRIPTWQWKVTLPKTAHQTVTATVGSETYTDDFYAPQGSNVTFSAKADPGYIAGNLSTVGTTLSKDLTVTVTGATESENIEAGTKTFGSDGVEKFTVPPKVHVLKWTWAGKDIYTKVVPGKSFELYISINPGYEELGQEDTYEVRLFSGGPERVFIDISETSDVPLSVAWSSEINEHAVDHDLTE